jgi:FKBP-type peptidyl-prolyl cis-trans isomerase 2
MIKTKDLIELDLIIKDNDTKDLLDTTKEDLAKKEGIYSKKITYKPLKVIFDKGQLLKGVEENIKDLDVGKTKTFTLTKDQAFGSRDSSKIKLLSINDFKKQNIKPKVGQHISFGKKTGKIINIAGNRVQVDFNHDFAGRDLEYTITLRNVYKKDEQKIKALFSKYFYFIPENKQEINIKDKQVEIILPQMLPKEVEYFKYSFVQNALEICKYEKIKFSQIYSKDKKEKK